MPRKSYTKFADEGLLSAAGFEDIKGEPITVTVEFPDIADFILYRQQISTQDWALRQNHPPEKVAETWKAVAEEAAANEDFARVWTSLSEFREGYELWGNLGYLP